MKHRITVLFCLLLTLGLLLAGCGQTAQPEGEAPADLLSRIQARGSIVVATEGDWSPWTYHDDADRLTGFDVELAQRIAEGLGVTVEFAETDWDAILAGVEGGRFDIACNGVDWTEARAEKFRFSTPYLYMREVLVVRGDNEDIHSIEDLAGRTTSNSPNSTYAEIAEAAGAELLYVNTLNETIMMLEQGRADATINAKVSIEDYLREHPDANIKIVYESEGTKVCIPVRADAETESLMTAIDGVLQSLREDGTLRELSLKYFGADLTREA
ncbi:MAG: transporter substrate-binding domain-containing protein [Oscillospiraceae bacterium]|nr:transporter substrate-binding domain-containing protein [Oscillospiraceae bacterium]